MKFRFTIGFLILKKVLKGAFDKEKALVLVFFGHGENFAQTLHTSSSRYVISSVLGLVLMNRCNLELKDINLLNWISLNWSSNQCFIKVAVAVKTLKEGSSVEEKIDFLSEAEMMKRFVDCHNWHIDCNVLTIIWWQKQYSVLIPFFSQR